MGLCNLRHLKEEIAKRKAVFERYEQHLSNIKGITFPSIQKGVVYNYAYLPIVFDGYKLSRDQVFDLLLANGVNGRKYFYPLISNYECYKDEFDSKKTPIAKKVSDNVLTLPMYANLNLEDVDMICDIILNRGN